MPDNTGANFKGGSLTGKGGGGISISKGLAEVAQEAAAFTNADAAYTYFRGRKGIPGIVAQEFGEKFGENANKGMREAFDDFYKYSKSRYGTPSFKTSRGEIKTKRDATSVLTKLARSIKGPDSAGASKAAINQLQTEFDNVKRFAAGQGW